MQTLIADEKNKYNFAEAESIHTLDRFHGTEPGDFSDRSHRSVSDVLFI